MNTPNELKYAASHEWIRDNGDGTATVGITDFAQDMLGDVVFVQTPEVGKTYQAGDEVGVVESVKTASDIFAPIGGTIIAVNESLDEAPEHVNSEPYAAGWFFKMQISDAAELSKLLSAADYDSQCD